MSILLLWFSSIVFAVFGVLFLVNPAGWAASVDVSVTNSTARTEIRAMYGGFELGIAAFLAWCALDPARVRIGLVAAGCMFAGVALGRLGSILLDSGVRPIMYTLVSVEAAAAVLIVLALRR